MFPWWNYSTTLTDGELRFFDVVIVGAGLSGGLIGRVLAERGLSVLFLEIGKPASQDLARTGLKTRIMGALGMCDLGPRFAANARWSTEEGLRRGVGIKRFFPPIGQGPGGSSAIYGAALERMTREDFTEKIAPGEGALPNAWPLEYDDFKQWYVAAETLLNVCGSADPLDEDESPILGDPPPLSEQDRYFFERFEQAGLHPYRLHVGIEYRAGCAECIGRLCPRGCKADGASRGLEQALSQYAATIAFGVSVEAVLMDGARVTGVRAR